VAWQDVIARGSGRTEFRLVIEGYEVEWVTSSALAGASTHGRTRRVGLKRSSLSFGDRIVPVEAKLEGDGISAEIVDIDGHASREFARRARVLGRVGADVSSSATALTVENSSVFATSTYYHVGTECVLVTAIPDGTSLTVTRQQRATLPQAHFVNDASAVAIEAPITDHPFSARGRRAYLYGYGDGETGDGYGPIWRGQINAPPSRNGVTSWRLTIDPIVSVLDQDTSGADLRATSIRGFYYPYVKCLQISFGEIERPIGGNGVPTGTHEHTMRLTGFYSDPMNLASAITTWMDSNVNADSDIDGIFGAAQNGIDDIKIFWRAPSSNAIYHEPFIKIFDLDYTGHVRAPRRDNRDVGWWDLNNSLIYTFDLSPAAALFTRPFAWFGGIGKPAVDGTAGVDLTALTTAPFNRIYLNEARGFAVGGGMELGNIEFGQGLMQSFTPNSDLKSATTNSARLTVSLVDDDSDIDSNYIEAAEVTQARFAGGVLKADTEIKATQIIAADGNIAAFASGLVTRGVDANKGEAPFITSEDLADWTGVIAAAAGASQYSERLYAFNKPENILEIIAADLQLLGCYLTVDSTGKVTVAKLAHPLDSGPDSLSITDADILVSDSWPEWQIEEDGFYSAVSVKTGWDSFLEQYTGPEFLYRDTTAIGLTKRLRTLEIEPRSQPKSATIDRLTYEQNVRAVLGFYSRPYYLLTLRVPMTKFALVPGQSVLITSKHVPDPSDGTMGITSHPCLLVGRAWDLNTGIGTLNFYMFPDPLHGYAPSARIINASSTDTSAGARTSFQFAITSTFYAPSGKKDVAYFAVGDFIQVQKYDEAGWSGEFIDGTITAIDTAASTMDVTFGSAMPGGFPGALSTPTYIIHFQIDAATPTAHMRSYAYTGEAGLGITVGGSTDTSLIPFSP
jgi:hypothetical protein